MTFLEELERIRIIANKQDKISHNEVREIISLVSSIFTTACLDYGYDARQILRVKTKLRDAGRRSPPWKPTSSRVPDRPQAGSDGNRILRWKLKRRHKFYANEMTATLTEVKYYLQLLSMDDAPEFPENTIQECFSWLIEHDIKPGYYLDPIQLIPISLRSIIDDARVIQSGHLYPLDRGGKHEPENAFLMLLRSNQLQGNLTIDELIQLMDEIVKRHKKHHKNT
jgi:hypothetical protein